MDNNFKSLLEAIYWTESNKPMQNNTFLFETDFSEKCIKQIKEQWSEPEQEKVIDLLTDLQNEMLNIGYINGFKTCIRLFQELSGVNNSSFLSEILYGKPE